MRATFMALVWLGWAAGGAVAQTSPRGPAQTPPAVQAELGSPEAAFAGGPIKLSKGAAALLRSHYQGDKVPIIPQPFRGRLDTALAARDWPRIETIKKEMTAAYGLVAVLAWEQTRFIGTGGIGIAELHALDVAATGSSGLAETAAMLWLYAVAATMTDGHKCADQAAKEAHLDKLRGPMFEPVLKHVRGLTDDRVVAMRDIAMRLESLMAPDRTDDTVCRTGPGKPDLRPEALWRPAATSTRGMLPKHMAALTAVMRPKTAAKPEPAKPGMAKPAVAKPEPPKPATVPVVAVPAQPVGPPGSLPAGARSSLLAPLALPGAAGFELPGALVGGPLAGGLTSPPPSPMAAPGLSPLAPPGQSSLLPPAPPSEPAVPGTPATRP